ncbi:MAG TPA: MFS transporter [Candidatus Babeliales bacterium]|nr:MFS transporter [Candidatus Babeliales bacterium]
MKKLSWLSKDLIGISFTSLFNDFNHEMTTALLPAFIEQMIGTMHAPLALGIIMGFADACSMIMKLISGWLTNHVRYFKPILVIGYAITPIFTSLIGTALHIWQVFLYQIIAWMGRGLREPMKDVWLSQISSPPDYGKVYGFNRGLDTLGAIAGPTLAFFTIKYCTLPYNFFIAFIPGIISVLTLIFLTSNYKKNTAPLHPITFNEQIAQLPFQFKYFTFVMFVFGIANFNKTLLIYRAQQMFMGQTNISIIATGWTILLYILFNIIRALSEFSIGYLSDYVDRRMLLGIFGFGSFIITTFTLLFAETQIFLWMIIFMSAGLCTGTVTAVEKSYAAQLLPEEMRGIGFGLLQSIDGLGDLFSSVIVGTVWTFLSPQSAFAYSLLVTIVALILMLFVKQEPLNNPPEKIL